MRDVSDQELLEACESFFRSLDRVRKLEALRPVAEQGDVAAMREMAVLYDEAGRPIEAAKWWATAEAASGPGDSRGANGPRRPAWAVFMK